MQFESKDDFMAHFGVKGMKWGVRKDASGSASAAKASDDHKKVAELRAKPTHSLSNAQLKTINERLQLETTYARLDPGKVTSGRTKAEQLLKTVGVAGSLISIGSSPAGKAAIELGKLIIDNALKPSVTTVGASVPTGSPKRR